MIQIEVGAEDKDMGTQTLPGGTAMLESRRVNIDPVAREGPTETELDAALLARMIVGDHQALAKVYDRWSTLVFGIARRTTKDDQLAGDVTQDVFSYLWEHPDRVDLTKGSLRSYLGMLCHRRAVDAVRRAESRARSEWRAYAGSEGTSAASDVDVVDASASRWQATRLAEVVALLPDDQRIALTLAYFYGHTYREVAHQLNIPEGTAKSRLRLALARLREQLQNDDRWAWI